MLKEARTILSKKVNIPLKVKIAALTSLLLLITVGFYLTYATSIFKQEKAADIYLISMGNSTNLSDKVEIIADKYLKMIQIFTKTNSGNLTEELKKMASIHQDLLGASCLVNNDEQNPITYFQETSESNPEILGKLIANDLKKLRPYPIGMIQLERSNLSPFSNHFILNTKKDNYACAMHLSIDALGELNRNSDQLESFIVNDEGKIFFNISRKTNFDENVQKFYAQNIKSNSGVFKYNQKENSKIIAYSKVPSFDLYALTEIPEAKAFQASELLIKKSVYFGIALLSFALIFGILFSNSLTGALTYLSNAANLMAEGNFNTPIDHTKATNDEVGTLNFTFENMRLKIVSYMEEMKEKYRLENEVKVAQIVQKSFFPQSSIDFNSSNIFGLYKPASECGGDWWGYLEQGNKISVIICDATGHGVPAALLTAAAHSTVSNLNLESKKRYISPSEILTRLNQVVSLMKSSVQLTGFVFELDSETGIFKYSNASHLPALVFSKNNKSEYTKEDIVPLQETTGSRLGESFESIYLESTGILKEFDFVILYTDGILEFEKNGKIYGQRNFFKNILESLNSSHNNAESLTNKFMLNFSEFQEDKSLQDDITFLAISFAPKKEASIPHINSEEDIDNLLPGCETIYSSLSNDINIANILLKHNIKNLIGFNALSRELELQAIELIKQGKFYLETPLFQSFLESNDQIPLVTNELIEEIRKNNITKINTSVVSFVLEELLSNAFYHSVKNSEQNRGIKIVCDENPIEIGMEYSDTYLAIYVESPNQNPGIESILNSIHRGQTEKIPRQGGGGAGLGLYLIYEKAHQFWVIEKNNKLGFRIVFERFNRNIQSDERITSFHYIKLT